MSQDEILNYDHLRLNRVENIVELQEVIVVGDENTRIKSLLIPKSKLIGKTEEEVELVFRRAFWAFNIDPNCAVVNAALIDEATKALASRYTRLLVGNLALVYFERLAKGHGKDPEMEVVEECEVDDERDLAAARRLIKHMQSRTEASLISYFGEHPDLVTDFCREAIVNILGQVTLAILEEKGDDHEMTREERASIIRQSSWWRWYDYVELAAERWASGVLNRMNPAGIPFPALQAIVRSGLDVLLRRSVDDVGKILQKITKRATDEKDITLRVSADDKKASIKLPDGTEIVITLPEESPVSQASMTELVSSLGRGGANNQKIKASGDELKAYPGTYQSIQKALRTIGYVFKRLVRQNKDWRTGIQVEFPIMKDYPDLIEIIPVLCRDAEGSKSILKSIDNNLLSIAIEKGFSSPADIAAEISARQVFSKYRPFDVQPRWLRDTYA